MSTATSERQAIESFEIRKEIAISAPIEIAFAAMLEEIGPENELLDGTAYPFKLEPWPGGRWFRDLGNNTGHLWGHVQVIKPPTLLEICGPLMMSYPATNFVQYRFTAEGGTTRLTFIHQALGLIRPEHREGMPKGWQNWVERIRDSAESKHRKGTKR